MVLLLVGCLTSQHNASVSQGRICSENWTCCHTEIQVEDPTFYLAQSKCTDTRPTSPSADLITPGVITSKVVSDFESKRSNFLYMGRKSGSFSKYRGRNSVRIYFPGRSTVRTCVDVGSFIESKT